MGRSSLASSRHSRLERLDPPFRYRLETGRLSRLHLGGLSNVSKRLCIQACGGSFGLLVHAQMSVGTLGRLQGRPSFVPTAPPDGRWRRLGAQHHQPLAECQREHVISQAVAGFGRSPAPTSFG